MQPDFISSGRIKVAACATGNVRKVSCVITVKNLFTHLKRSIPV
jgi:hypothetical protein